MQIQYPDPPFYRKPLPAERVDELLKVDWFSSVKNPQIIAPLALSSEWEDFTLERRNDLTAFVSVKLQHRGSEWNKCARAFRAFFDEHLASTVLDRLAAANLPPELISCVGWDIVSYMQELNYADIRKPEFFHHLWLAYRDGNFPCGWTGSYPKGSLITA